MRATDYKMIIYETFHIPTRGEYQDFIQVQNPSGHVQCTHVNSCQNYTLYINLHILLNILCKATSNIQESRDSIKSLKR